MEMVQDFPQDMSVKDALDAMTLDGEIAAPNAMRDITPRRLSRRQKAAVVVRLLVGRGVSLGFSKLSETHQRELAYLIADMRNIDRITLMEVVREFTDQIDQLALSFPGNLSETVEMLEPFLSKGPADDLKAELINNGDPWAVVNGYGIEALRPLLETESAEVCAVMLSKLSVAKAAALLSQLPMERAEMLAHTMGLTDTITPDLVARIGEHVAGVLDARPKSAFPKTAADRVGAILNSTGKDAREGVLGGLETRNAIFAGDVKKAIFAFGHIPQRIQPADIPRILKDVDQVVIVTAIAAGMAEEPLSAEFILENMSKRLAEQVRDDAEAMGTPKEDDGNAAMSAIIAQIRTMEEAGDIKLIPPEG